MSITPIGYTNHQNKIKAFGIKDEDRGGHIYALGKTGTGKSTLLFNMALHDITTGKGVGILDPHGDVIEKILQHIPEERKQDIIYLNPKTEIHYNPLYEVNDYNRYTISSNLVTVFKKQFSESWGVRLEYILRNTIYTLTYYPQATLLHIIPLLTDIYFRNDVLQHVPNTVLQNFWSKEFTPLSPQQKNEFISPILNKIGIIQTHPLLSKLFGNPTSSFSIKDIMDTKKIFLANLSKGILGEVGSQLLGSFLVSEFQNGALEREKQLYVDRIPFHLYIDEMHSFISLSFADILSESRKYKLYLFLCHQFLDQLHEDIRKAILGNVGTIISFRIGNTDAELFEKEFYPIFTQDDFVSLPRFHFYIKLLIDGSVSEGFSGKINYK